MNLARRSPSRSSVSHRVQKVKANLLPEYEIARCYGSTRTESKIDKIRGVLQVCSMDHNVLSFLDGLDSSWYGRSYTGLSQRVLTNSDVGYVHSTCICDRVCISGPAGL